MNRFCPARVLVAWTIWVACGSCSALMAGELVLHLKNSGDRVLSVSAIDRWDADGNPRRPIDPKAKIDFPYVSATAKPAGSDSWRFEKLPPGRYDLIVMLDSRVRLEGFGYPPVLEFDPFLKPQEPAAAIASRITRDIAQSKHYENKVQPLFMSGDDKAVRVLVQLLRDEPTSFDAEFGQPAATLRHEIWQYQNRYGGWVKEKRTRVFHRLLLPTRELRTWTWLWDPRLGGIEVGDARVEVDYELSREWEDSPARGILRGEPHRGG